MRIWNFNLNINFPALDALVQYLQGAEQKKIDALSKQVSDLTTALGKSSSELQSSVETQK